MFKIVLISLLALNLYAQQRIVALSPAINEIIFALGAGDKIVANTTFCVYPEESKSIKKVGGYFSPSIEKILSVKPSMVIMQENNRNLAHKLQKIDIKSMVLKIDKIDSIKESILKIGRYVKKEKAAKELVKKIDDSMNSLKGILEGQKILIAIGHHLNLSKQIYVAGQNLYFDDIINASGNTNALQSKRKGQPVLNLENILALDPDMVILIAPYTKDKSLTKEALKKPWLELPISAAKTKRVYVEDKKYAGIASDRLLYFLEDFRRFLLNAKSR